MKTLALLILLASSASADVCYVFPRGSESWIRCKEQAAESDAVLNQIKADQRQVLAETSNAINTDRQNEQAQILFNALQREQAANEK